MGALTRHVGHVAALEFDPLTSAFSHETVGRTMGCPLWEEAVATTED